MNNKKYFAYILLAVLCPVVIWVYYVNDMACLHAVCSTATAGILTTGSAIIALKEYRGERKPIGHWLAAVIPAVAILVIPIAMISHIGLEALLAERILAFATMEGFAIAQLVLAVLMFRSLIFKRGEDRLMMPGIGFLIMKAVLTVRNLFRKPGRVLHQMGLQKGQSMLDYGCGIGSFTIPAAKTVGDDGTIYALDIHPLAIRAVEKEAKKERISNIKTILSDRGTGLPDESVDIVLLYDVLQMIRDKDKLLEELHRVLKAGGSLFATAEHLQVSEFLNTLTRDKLFTLVGQKGRLYQFRRGTNLTC